MFVFYLWQVHIFMPYILKVKVLNYVIQQKLAKPSHAQALASDKSSLSQL